MQNDKCGANIHRENVTLREMRKTKYESANEWAWALRGENEESNKLAKKTDKS